jgi:hypothetical protein
MTFKDKTCLIAGRGIDLEHAVRLAKDFGKTIYCTDVYGGGRFPGFDDFAIGLGVEGLTKTDANGNPLQFWNCVDEADLIVYFDCGLGDQIEYLRRQGKRVFGAGRAERLELDRWYARQEQKKRGLPTQETRRVRGVEALRKELERRKAPAVVKHNIFRRSVESFKVSDVGGLADKSLDEAFGPFTADHQFLVESDVGDGTVEVGFDLIVGDDGPVLPLFYGYEYDGAYIGKVADKLPKPLARVWDAFAPLFRAAGYRGMMSTEALITKAGDPYLIDFTCRPPYPLSLAYTELIQNYTEVVWAVAGGEPVTAKCAGKYFGCLPISADWADQHWVKLAVENRKTVKLQYAAKQGGDYWIVPHNLYFGCVVAVDDTIAGVVRKLHAAMDDVDAFQLHKETAHHLARIQDTIREGVKHGIEF